MALNWIKLEDYPFHSLLMAERFQIEYIMASAQKNQEYAGHLAQALHANPLVAWTFGRRCPQCAPQVEALLARADRGADGQAVRRAELYIMERAEDFIVYAYPEIMDQSCDFIYAWDPSRLYELADLSGKVVLDVGAGSGRLAFAAAKKARFVVASEPVASLREHMRDRIAGEGIRNMAVVDGMAHALPYPDGLFDIVMSGHVVGDDYPAELAELMRVVKSGGWVLDCPGEDSRKRPLQPGERDVPVDEYGFERLHYVSPLGGDVYRYRKQIIK